MRLFSLTLLLAALWLAMSGHFSPLILGLGALSVALIAWLSCRMDIVDVEGLPLHTYPRIAGFGLWLTKQIVESNVAMARVILGRELQISPRMLRVDGTQRTDVGRVLLAHSITLTPGTVTVDVDGAGLRVHAINAEATASLVDRTMPTRVAEVDVGRSYAADVTPMDTVSTERHGSAARQGKNGSQG